MSRPQLPPDGADRHANARDRKSKRAKIDRLMRGSRSVFEIQKSIAKRGKQAKGEETQHD